jgi:hypothetical protein
VSDTDYTPDFYEIIREGCRSSAEIVVPRVLDYMPPIKSVIDVGCGEGWWGKAFRDNGCETVLGLDGGYVTPVIPSIGADLESTLPEVGTFDLAVCLEVAEHLSPSRAESFVAELCILSPIVFFSAAVPGQGGAGHLNEQPITYWVRLFNMQGFWCSDAIRWAVWEDKGVEVWYRQNMFLASKGFLSEASRICDVIHPFLFDARRRA